MIPGTRVVRTVEEATPCYPMRRSVAETTSLKHALDRDGNFTHRRLQRDAASQAFRGWGRSFCGGGTIRVRRGFGRRWACGGGCARLRDRESAVGFGAKCLDNYRLLQGFGRENWGNTDDLATLKRSLPATATPDNIPPVRIGPEHALASLAGLANLGLSPL